MRFFFSFFGAGPQRGMTFVDLAGGTGDVTFRIVDALRAQVLFFYM